MADINHLIVEINTVTKEIKDAFSPFLTVGRMALGLGAVIWISVDAYKVLATGEHDGIASHFRGWLKPLFISLLLMLYNPLLSICDFLMEPTYAATQGWAVSYMKQNEQIEDKYQKDLENIYMTATVEEKRENSNEGDGMMDSLKGVAMGISTLVDKIRLYTSPSYILGLLLMLLSKIVNFCLIVSYLGILVMQNINLAVIIAFGPISIGLSIFHPFSDNWKAFFSNYISKLLWYPVANMSLAIAYRLKNISDQNAYDILLKFAKASVSAGQTVAGSINNATGMTGIDVIQTIDWVPIFLSIGVTIVGCFAVINTPSLVSNIITGVSGGMTSSPVSGTMAAGAIGALTYKGIGALRGMISSPNNGSSLSNSNPANTSSSVSSPETNANPKVFGAPKPSENRSNIEM
ncbi:hypothetical protein [Cellulophaga sp. BC115SP]|uniref:hypothetical protein n=1 Tax=Cellulophaga sp. BC115SP TaxID=2683263 RepID=UPI001412DA59|nr:hypothetical protein [Cellulophaga sp. BC115SP]NBB29930.1 hypothetical protein [Cellulophaga sp. BC115SP]